MELKIISKKEEPLLSRVNVESEIIFEKSTPSKGEIKNELAKVLGKDQKLLAIKGIYMVYGLKKAKILSYVYENEESLNLVEIKKKNKTKKEGKEGKAEGKPSEKSKEQKE